MVYHSFHQLSDFTDELTIVKFTMQFHYSAILCLVIHSMCKQGDSQIDLNSQELSQEVLLDILYICNVSKRRVKKVYIILKNLQRDSFRGSYRQTHVFYNFGLYVLCILFLLVGLSLFEKSGSMKTDKHAELVRI